MSMKTMTKPPPESSFESVMGGLARRRLGEANISGFFLIFSLSVLHFFSCRFRAVD